jgi:hypothetical protein
MGGHGWSLGQVKVVLAVPELGVSNLPTFAIEKKDQRKRGTFSLKCSMSNIF